MSAPKSSREWFCEARDAARLIMEYDDREMAEIAKAGIRPRSLSPRFQVGMPSDPMRHVDAAVDMQARRNAELSSARDQVAEAWQVVGGIADAAGPRCAIAVALRFLLLMTWEGVAKSLGTTRTEAERLASVAFDVVDSEGIARMRERSHSVTRADDREEDG